jgi:hypothetical protein
MPFATVRGISPGFSPGFTRFFTRQDPEWAWITPEYPAPASHPSISIYIFFFKTKVLFLLGYLGEKQCAPGFRLGKFRGNPGEAWFLLTIAI